MMQRRRASAHGDQVAVARGYGVRIKVSGRHLVIEDGFGQQRRTRRFHRTAAPRRLLVIARNGYLTFDVLRWLADVVSVYVHLDPSGEVLATSATAGKDLPALRRSQARAIDGPAGFEIAHYLLRLKVEGQRDVLAQMPGSEDARARLDDWARRCDTASSINELLEIERGAAADYWESWAEIPVRLVGDGRRGPPDHWHVFGTRASLIGGGPRGATNPGNAILNLLYTLARIETTFSCHALGLDPGIAMFHCDREGRESLADDLIEAIRPHVDSFLLELLRQRTFSVWDFAEQRDGSVRVAPRLAERLGETLSIWREQVGPVAEHVRDVLARGAASPVPLTTPLTGGNQLAALDDRMPARRRRAAPRARLPATCRGCGRGLTNGSDRWCANCKHERAQEQRARSRRTVADLGDELRDKLMRQVLAALEQAPSGMTRTEVHAHFSRNPAPGRLGDALKQLEESGRARREIVRGGRGRPAERWSAIRWLLD